MKIRNGYVSNSSSSSFIVSDKGELVTVKDVAFYIINTINFEWGSDNYGYIDELNTLMTMSNPDTPVNFNTGGDQTYIRKVDDKIVICTTQNISFPKIMDNALNADDISEEFYRKFDFIDEYKEEIKFQDPNDFDYYHPKFDDFLILKHNFYGRHTYVDNCPNCKKNYSRGWILKGGKEICDCKISLAIRKEKLNKINES